MKAEVAFLLLSLVAAAQADEFDTLRLKWRDLLTGGTNLNLADPAVKSRLGNIADAATSYWNSMDKSPSRTHLWSDAARTNKSADIGTSYDRLRAMALAWGTRGCALQGNTNIAKDIVGGLDWMYANRYNETKAKYDNWWSWEIGAPQRLNDAAVLMFDALTGEQITNYNTAVDKFSPSASLSGANRTDKCLVVAIRGILGRNSAKLANARDGLSPVFLYVTKGDGFYRDGSFIQHSRVPYTGSYGSALLDAIPRLMLLLAGSTWQVTDPNQTNVFHWIHDSYEPVIYRGAMMDMLRGRAISRTPSQDHNVGDDDINSIQRIAQFAPPADAAAFKRIIKYWILADSFRSYTNSVPLNLLALTQQLMADTNVQPRGELVGHFQFPCMDRVVHLRPGFGFGISMCSSRIYNYESINCENLHGWFTGDGMTYLYNSDLGQFSSDFWPTVDPYHLPGTTVDTTTRANASGQSKTSSHNWVGGAVLSNSFGAAGMALAPWGSPLVAKKSWFMFDDEIVCLGAGITCTNNSPVHTTVENRRLASTPTNNFTVNGAIMSATIGWSSNLTGVLWCTLDGASSYYFPGGANVQVVREARTDSWWNINQRDRPTGSLTNPLAENYLKLWFDHGVKPTNATYAYVLLPNLGANDAGAYAANPGVLVLTNSPAVQAVRELALGIVAANFWDDGTNSADLITVDGKAAVVTRETATTLELAVAEPTHTKTGNLAVILNRAATCVLSADTGITVAQLTPQIRLLVNVNGAQGRTFQAKFSFSAQSPDLTRDTKATTTGAQDASGTWDVPAMSRGPTLRPAAPRLGPAAQRAR